MNAMKTSAGEAFRVVDDTFRVGLHTINNPERHWQRAARSWPGTFTGTQKTNWYTRFYQQIASGNTPLRAAQQRIGEYYRAGTSPAGGSVPDPIQYSCQQNYHLLTTDGQWNSYRRQWHRRFDQLRQHAAGESGSADGTERRVRHHVHRGRRMAAPVSREARHAVDEHPGGRGRLLLDDRPAADDDEQRVHLVDQHGQLAAHGHLSVCRSRRRAPSPIRPDFRR
jgi:hypothetical protein